MKTVIRKITQESKEARSFRLDKLFDFKPGQWMYVSVHKPQDANSNLKHMFTISASPTEDYLQFTTKFREESEYKQILWSLSEGAEIEINGPFGGFVLNESNKSPRVFLAGGIGITPFRAMKKYVIDKELKLSVVLIASFKTKDEVIFEEEIDKLVITSSDGRLDDTKIKLYCENWKDQEYWICGSASFVDAMKEILLKMGIDEKKMFSEDFPGY